MKTALDILSQAVAVKPIHLLIIGGHAMQIYGVIRQTLDVDVLLVDAPTFDHLHQNSREYSKDVTGLRMPALQHLIALKLHALKNAPARETKDLPDILELFKRNPSMLSEKELTSLCERFGPAGIMKKIKQWLP